MRGRLGKRLGRFSLGERIVEDNSGAVRRLMGVCIILRCEFTYHDLTFYYTAQSELFDEVEEGSLIPEYVPFFCDDPQAPIRFERRG